MKYQYIPEKTNYEDYAAGRVLYSQAGMTSFPVRLASEIFMRCALLLNKPHLRVYDPCCGSGYLLTILGFLHSDLIRSVWGSDIAPTATAIAQKNLGLLSASGLATRHAEIEAMLQTFGKASHQAALTSVEVLQQQLPQHPLEVAVWLGDGLQTTLKANSVDILITDVPYGDVTAWYGQTHDDPLYQLLDAQYQILARPAFVAIISDKKQKAAHPKYQRILHDTLGKRRITLLQPL